MVTIAASDTSAVAGAIGEASRSTGVGFEFLMRTAGRESSMNPNAKAATSSAAGLFQFIENTWLSMVKQTGDKHGLGAYADQIVERGGGRYAVPDADARETILDLRYDPRAASAMAGELTSNNHESLTRSLGRAPSEGELYIAHFLGAKGAADLVRMAAHEPDAPAARDFPRQAAANRAIFYEGGAARSALDVYRNLVAKHQSGPAPASPAAAYAEPAREAAEPAGRSPLGERFAWRAGGRAPVFHGLFTGAAGETAAPVANAAWSAFAPAEPRAAARHFVEMMAPMTHEAVAAAPTPEPAMLPPAREADAAPRDLLSIPARGPGEAGR